MGFRGGVFANGSNVFSCTLMDYASFTDAGEKGEGISVGGFPGLYGKGNLANGAGGGNCHNAGGGGGGHAGEGGVGGNTWPGSVGELPEGGLGGAAMTYSLYSHASFGGGGGAAHGNNNVGGSGGAGGGIVWVRADRVLNSGSVLARGADGGSASANDAAGGGGAGGAIFVYGATELDCEGTGVISADGGDGGDVDSQTHGPGAGGGGGKVLYVSPDRTCATVTADNGIGGVEIGDDPFGAGRTSPGDVESEG